MQLLRLPAICAMALLFIVAGCDTAGEIGGPADEELLTTQGQQSHNHIPVPGEFQASLQPLNAVNGIEEVRGDVWIRVLGNRFFAQVTASGLFPDIPHAQHIHAADECPTMDADANGDGFIDVLEGVPSYGPILVPLDSDLSTQAGGDFPMSNPNGSLFYRANTSGSALLADLRAEDPNPNDPIIKLGPEENLNLAGRHVVVHGVDPDMDLPSTVATIPGLPAQATLPVACGELNLNTREGRIGFGNVGRFGTKGQIGPGFDDDDDDGYYDDDDDDEFYDGN